MDKWIILKDELIKTIEMKEEIYLIDYVFMINFKMNQLTLKHATQPVKF